mmetsp:Transcript_137726/g.242841  ORF Transcript_137726/g.242841 Transcript_137726/m.242841 type:complete len:103 (-) Transcript_137726:8-316(-)
MRSFRGQCGKSASIISSHERACLDLICKAHSWLGLCFKSFGSIPAVCAVDEPFTEAECCYSQKISCTVQETGIFRLMFKIASCPFGFNLAYFSERAMAGSKQ